MDQLMAMVSDYKWVNQFAWDVETVGSDRLNTLTNEVVWISFATADRCDVIPMGHPNGEFVEFVKPLLSEGLRRQAKGMELRDPQDYSKDESKWVPMFTDPPAQLLPAQVFAALKPILFGPAVKVAQNAKYDLKSVSKYYGGKVPSGPHFDTMVAAFILDNRDRHGLGLAAIAQRELHVTVEKGIGARVENHDFESVAKYSGIDSEITLSIYERFKSRLAGTPLESVFALEMDVLQAVCDMELTGALIDESALGPLDTNLRRGIEEARGEVFRLAGRAFNMNSTRDKQTLLFSPKPEGRGIKVDTKNRFLLTPKGVEYKREGVPITIAQYAVSAEALAHHAGKDPLIDAMLTYSDLNKLHNTYVVPYKGGEVVKTVNGVSKTIVKESLLLNGRVHTDFKQCGAETGRFSCSNPNLQAIPSSGEFGKLIRGMFIVRPGEKMIQADYSQIEPRIIASLSGDPVMVKNYLEGGDLYVAVGDSMGVTRKVGKTLVLAIAYGVGPEKIAQDIGCSRKEAISLQTRFAKRFPDIPRHKSRVIKLAASRRPTPFVETVFGRRRYIPELLSREPGTNESGQRKAYNTLIQGTASDIMKTALVRAHSCFVDEPSVNLIMTIHDELIVVAPEDLAFEVGQLLQESMEGVSIPEITVPLVAEVKIVDNWSECK